MSSTHDLSGGTHHLPLGVHAFSALACGAFLAREKLLPPSIAPLIDPLSSAARDLILAFLARPPEALPPPSVSASLSSCASLASARAVISSLSSAGAFVVRLDTLGSPVGRAPRAAGSRDASAHQAARDVERDVFLLRQVQKRWGLPDEELLRGATLGYDAVRARVRDALLAAAAGVTGVAPAVEVDVPPPPVSAAALSEAAQAAGEVLSLANRTVSGGDGFDAALRALLPGEEDDPCSSRGALPLFLAADSFAAHPVEISVSFGEGREGPGVCYVAGGGSWPEGSAQILLDAFPPLLEAVAAAAAAAAAANAGSAHALSPTQLLQRAGGWGGTLRCGGVRVRIAATTAYHVLVEGAGEGGEPLRLAAVTATYERSLVWHPLIVAAGGEQDIAGMGVCIEEDVSEGGGGVRISVSAL